MPKMVRASSGKKRFIEGYTDDARLASVNHLCPPSQNCYVLDTGEAVSRGGLTDSGWNLAEASKAATSLHLVKYNVTFFALNGKVKYIEHDRGDAVVDTGLSLTATETTRFAEYAGDVYLTNRTDGLRQIHVFRLNDSAPTSGDASVTIDQDGAGRLLAFGDTSGNLRIRGTNEAYNAVAITGAVTLVGTLSQTYANNDIAITVEDISANRPKGSGITFWKERMIVWGVIDDQATYDGVAIDDCTNTVYQSEFATRGTIEEIISFNTAGTADIVQLGFGGSVTHVISTRDYLYYFTNSTVHYTSVADVDQVDGTTAVQLLSTKYGCRPECAADLGNGRIAFLTYDNRIISIDISTQSGAPVVFPNEQFDSPYKNTLRMLDRDQTGFFFHSSAESMLFAHVDIDSERVVLPFDTTIQRWQPPIRGWSHASMFVKNGVTYATDSVDDTIYLVNDGRQDNGFEFECIIATPIFENEDGRTLCEWRNVGISGRVTENATVTLENIVSEGDPVPKTLSLSGVSFSIENGLGAYKLGSRSLSSATNEAMGNYDKNIAIPITWGTSYQLVLSSISPFTLKSYSVNDDSYLTLV